MQKRYLPITVATAVLLLIALGGYLIPASSNSLPLRVLLDNKGGKVILNHAAHADIMDGACADCHHTTGNDPNPPACTDCHAAKFDAAFASSHQENLDEALCRSCHHPAADIERFNHDEHAVDMTGGDCQACHHDESIEPEPQACANCHTDGSNSVLRLRDAAHARCADCHSDMYDEGIKGCSNCHVRNTDSGQEPEPRACSDCHATPTDQLLPTTMNAFHGQCMGCHEEKGAGPSGDDACYQCHMK